MDGAVHSASAQQGRVGRVDDGVGGLLGDVARPEEDQCAIFSKAKNHRVWLRMHHAHLFDQSFHAGQFLAFQELQRSAAAGGDVGDLIGDAGSLAPPPRCRRRPRWRWPPGLSATASAIFLVPLVNASISKTPMGPFQTMVRAVLISSVNSSMVSGPMSSAILSAGIGWPSSMLLNARAGIQLVGDHVVHRQQELHVLGLGFGQRLGRQFHLVGLQQRLADLLALRLQEGISHATTDDQRIHLGQQVADDADFVADFGAAQNRQKGFCGCAVPCPGIPAPFPSAGRPRSWARSGLRLRCWRGRGAPSRRRH